MIEDLGESGKLVVGYARRIAATMHYESVGPEHLVLGVGALDDVAIRRALLRANLDIDELCTLVRSRLKRGSGSGLGQIPLTPEAERTLQHARDEAVALGERDVEVQHIVLALLRSPGDAVASALGEMGLDLWSVHETFGEIVEAGEITPSEFYKTRRSIEQAGLGSTSELLDSVGRDLTKVAARGELNPIIGRDREIGELVRILLGRRKNNAVLIGDAGVGKTAVVEGLAQRIVRGEVRGLDGMQIRTIEVGSLVAGTVYRGQFEERLKDLIDGVKERTDVILFIDEVHMLVGAGETGLSGSVDAANMLKPVLSEGKLKVIGSTTTDEYRKYLEPDRALMRRFQPVVVGEPSAEVALTILEGLRPKYEEFHLVKVADEALRASVDLSVRHIHERNLPDKAIDLIDRACTEKKLEAAETDDVAWSSEAPLVRADDIAELVSVMLEIPVARLAQDEKEQLARMADALKERVIGQDHAIDAVVQAIIRARTGFGDSDRPYGVFLFLGPTGVGKTKLAEELSALLFGERDELIGFDLSQYLDPFSISELIGTKTGMVGWDQGGKLTNAVRRKPYSVVLLDEFEKAHPAVWNLFLPIFDNGRMSDALDRVIDFRNTVIIMTSNVGARRFQARTRVGFVSEEDEAVGRASFESVEDDVLKDLKDVFSPEFLNRIDEIVIFNALTMDAIRDIVRRRIEETVPVELDLTPDALEFLVQESYDPAMGARPVRRAIQRLVANPLSMMIARDELAEGDRVMVGIDGGSLNFATGSREGRNEFEDQMDG